MGWKATLRSMEASTRRSIKNTERRHKQEEKIEELNSAKNDVRLQEQYIEKIISIHKYSPQDNFDWDTMATQSAPLIPLRNNICEIEALFKYENFKPSLINKIFHTTDRKKNKLKQAISNAILKDDGIHKNAIEQYNKNYIRWEKEHSLANRLTTKEPKAYIDAIKEFNPFKNLEKFFSELGFLITDCGNLIINILVFGDSIIPTEKLSLRTSGSLLKKPMPKAEFNKFYQDYICSCTLRVAAEALALLPIDHLIINAKDNLLNSATGYIEDQTILSVKIMRKTFETLNIPMVNPMEAMKNFIHNMSFKKTIGFSVIEEIVF